MSPSAILIDQVRRRLRSDQTDAQLLDAFVNKKDRAAFSTLMERYGPLVCSVCRRQVNDEHAADDASQATFLTLMRQAARVRPAALPAWLVCVARRIGRKARLAESRRKKREATAASKTPASAPRDDLSIREVMSILDEEVLRLPSRYQSALLACYWQGLSQAEAARRQGMSQSALKGLLERGRIKLLARLRGRGLTGEIALHGLFIAPLAAVLKPSASRANVAAVLDRPISASVAALLPHSGISRLGIAAGVIVGLTAGLVAVSGAMQRNQPEDRPPLMAAGKPASGVDRLGDPLPDGALLRLGTERFKHPNNAEELALSPNGKVVVTIGSGALIAWDARSGKELWRNSEVRNGSISGSIAAMKYLALSPDSKRLFTTSTRNSIAVFDVANGRRETVTLKGPDAPAAGGSPNMRSIDVSADGKNLAIGAAEGAFLCDLDGTIRRKIPRIVPTPNVPAVNGGPPFNRDRLLFFGSDGCLAQYSPDGKTVAVTDCSSKLLRLCDSTTGNVRLRINLDAYLVRMAFSPDSKQIAVTERDKAVRVYDTGSGKRLHSWAVKLNNPYENYASAVTYSPDGKWIAAGATDHAIYLFDAGTGKESGRLTGTGWYPWGLAFASDSKTLFSTGWDGPIRRWDVATRKQLPLPDGAVRGSEVVAASPDGKMLAYADGEGGLRFVDPKSGKEMKRLATPIDDAVHIAFSRDSRLLAVGGSRADQVHVSVLDLATDKVMRKWEWEKGRDPHSTVEDIVFSPDGKQLAVAVFRRGEFRLLDLAAHGQRAIAHQEIYGLDYSPDGTTLATAGWDKVIRLWNPASGELRNQVVVNLPQVQDPRMYGVKFSPDGKLLATANMSAALLIWDAKSLTVKRHIQVDRSFISKALAFSPDGLRLATGDAGGVVQLWDPQTGVKLWERGQHGGHMYVLSFGRDSRMLLAGGNGIGYLWDLRPKELPKKNVSDLWNDLMDSDAVAAERAFWALVEKPDNAVALFSKRVQPRRSEAIDPERVKKLIAELDDTRFSKREAAYSQLAKMGLGVVPELKKSLAETTSAEVRKRLTKLIDRLSDNEATVLKYRRLVSVLWHAGTPAAKELLEHWAKTAGDSLGEIAGEAMKAN